MVELLILIVTGICGTAVIGYFIMLLFKWIEEQGEVDKHTSKLLEYMNTKYQERTDKDNIFGVGVTDAEFRRFIIDYLLGENWYIVDPLGQTQINELALYEILEKYSKRYQQERKHFEANYNELNSDT